jgi:hypothetical protein
MNAEKIKHVTQPDKCGCVIASIAMVTGEEYKDISGTYIAHDLNKHGYNTKCQNKIINDLGFSTHVYPYLPNTNNLTCILTVNSINHTDSWHALVYMSPTTTTRARVLDPNKGYKPRDPNDPKHEHYTLKMIQDIVNDPKKLHDCTVVSKSSTEKPTNTGITKAEKTYTNVVNDWTGKDCESCTDTKITNSKALKYKVAGGSNIYGESTMYDDDIWG